MTSESERIDSIVAALLSRTTDGDASWYEGETDSYVYESGSATVIIKSRDNDGVAPYQLRILNEDGAVVSTVNSDYSDSSALALLYLAARESVRKVDHTLDTLLRDLSE